ncbi:hypothetical protein SAMN04488063_0594 [Halopelagius inordinatus]|uniref:DUF2892 domain-containing protein n=1 Tax=Halopelagius inordinatus TaxID=553467 RepID=A0A1I2M664_9EURY|nr:hypothetical protein [Halopelagius inordinatus]SFF86993.1 hypothetical protein SAMN04488063_0594 [Halopelagius inordinatus]
MDLRKAVRDRERLARTLLAFGLSVVAIRSLRNGKRLSGLLAGGGALAAGYAAVTPSGELEDLDELTETLDVGTTDEDADDEDSSGRETTEDAGKLRCAACGEPISTGQTRGPNENDEIVHLDCK